MKAIYVSPCRDLPKWLHAGRKSETWPTIWQTTRYRAIINNSSEDTDTSGRQGKTNQTRLDHPVDTRVERSGENRDPQRRDRQTGRRSINALPHLFSLQWFIERRAYFTSWTIIYPRARLAYRNGTRIVPRINSLPTCQAKSRIRTSVCPLDLSVSRPINYAAGSRYIRV